MRITSILLASFVLLFAGVAAAQRAVPKAQSDSEKARLEAAFKKTMTGAQLVGSFTIDGPEGGGRLREERYTIKGVEKVGDDRWRFYARVQYGKFDVTVPMVLRVSWAGDTPVIMLTDFSIPMLGTYTARVLIYRGHYAGTWSGKTHGGKLFGRIERAPKDAKNAKPAKASTGGLKRREL